MSGLLRRCYFIEEVSRLSYQAGVHKKGEFSILDLIKNTIKSEKYSKAGVIAQFIGVVRGETVDGEKVQKLKLEAYEDKANEALTNICADLSRRKGVVNVQIHHLLGEFKVGEELVYVSVAGSHRSIRFRENDDYTCPGRPGTTR